MLFSELLEVPIFLGGSDSSIMYNLAVRTNGFYIFSNEQTDYFVSKDLEYLVYFPSEMNLIYAQNPQVSGKGKVQLTPLIIPADLNSYIPLVNAEINVQDHNLSDDFNQVILTVGDSISSWSFDVLCNSILLGDQTFYFGGASLMSGMTYNVTLDYEYKSSNVQFLENRLWISDPITFWPPFPN